MRSMACNPIQLRTRARGIALVEFIIAALLTGVALAAAVSMWYFSLGVTVKTDESGIGYNLARREIERVKQMGFYATPEGTAVSYYTLDQESANAQTGYYKLTRTVTSDLIVPNSDPIRPGDRAVRTLVLKIERVRDNVNLYQTTTYLVRSGV